MKGMCVSSPGGAGRKSAFQVLAAREEKARFRLRRRRRKSESGALAAVFLAVVLAACGTKNVAAQLDFQYSEVQKAIVCGEIAYEAYGIPAKADMTEQIGILNQDGKDKIFSFQDYPREEFIIEYPETGLMDNPVLFRAAGCDVEPEGVYTFEREKSEPGDVYASEQEADESGK